MNSKITAPATPRRYARVLSIAGSDSGGGAGIQADLKTFSALGCYGMTAITAITAQNTCGVTGIHGIPPEMLKAQIDAVVQDIGVDAVKIGMLHSPEVVRVVADAIRRYQLPHVVLDPVMVATSGDRLIAQETAGVLVQVKREQAQRTGEAFTPQDEVDIKQPILDQYEHQGHPYYSSARLWDDGVIDPAQTRDVLALGLSAALSAPIDTTRFGVFRM